MAMIPYQETFFKIMAAPFMGSFVCAILRTLVFLRSKKEGRKWERNGKKGRRHGREEGKEGKETSHLQIGIPSLQHAKFTHTEELLTSQRTQEDKKREESSLWCSKKIYTHFDPAHFLHLSSCAIIPHSSPSVPSTTAGIQERSLCLFPNRNTKIELLAYHQDGWGSHHPHAGYLGETMTAL